MIRDGATMCKNVLMRGQCNFQDDTHVYIAIVLAGLRKTSCEVDHSMESSTATKLSCDEILQSIGWLKY